MQAISDTGPGSLAEHKFCVTGPADWIEASREKSENHLLANLPKGYYKYVYIIFDSQSRKSRIIALR
jgi:hypothetical protein